VFEGIELNCISTITKIRKTLTKVKDLSLRNKKEQAEFSGNTLRVYWYIVRKRQYCGVREIQRALGFSSSSSAHYHLEQLVSKGVLIKDSYGNYKISNTAKVGFLSPFFIVRGFVFPMQLLYAVATTLMCVLFVAFFWKSLTLTVIFALSPGIVASGIFWYDAVKVWRSLPSFNQRSVR
jgi:predicted DNA-binding transcriptional regulator